MRPVVRDPISATPSAAAAAVLEALTAITAVFSSVTKMTGSAVKEAADGKKFRMSQYTPYGMPVNAVHGVKSVSALEPAERTAAAISMLIVRSRLRLKKSGTGCRCSRCAFFD